jgi:DNA mismatch endonuclease (patch repair protein)
MTDYKEEIIKVPRFTEANGFYTTEARSHLMSKIKSKNTSPELLMRKTLWALGIRYRIHNKLLPGNPDVVIKKSMLIIFVDGEFWHGYNWKQKRESIKTNKDFWIAKIERNMQRDISSTIKLEALGFTVLRFWEKQIKTELKVCIETILSHT